MPRETSQEIEEEAAAWTARLDRGLTETEQRALDSWLAADVRRAGAYARVRAIALYSQRARALGPDFDPADFIRPSEDEPDSSEILPSRRRVLGYGAGSVAAAAAASIAMMVGVFRSERWTRYDTRRGEQRVVTLADGSVMTMNTASEVEVHLSSKSRNIRLLSGQALFDVAHDTSRPFVVEAGRSVVRAIGTSFTVSSLADNPIQVLVREGLIEMSRAGSIVPPVRVPAHTRAIAAPDSMAVAAITTPIDELQMERELAWREGRLAFKGETLREAAATFARYSDIPIVIRDPTVANEQIVGYFVANDPIAFAVAAAASLDLQVECRDGEVRMSRRT